MAPPPSSDASDDPSSWSDDALDRAAAADGPRGPILARRTDVVDPPASAATPAPSDAVPSAPRWRNTAITAGLVVIAAVVAVVLLTRDDPVELEANGRPIRNAEAVLGDAAAAFTALVRADGATPHEDARCYFAPPDDGGMTADAPRIACGPVLLGVSGDDRPWVVGRARYLGSATVAEVTASFDGFVGVEDIDRGTLRRPDGKKAPGAEGLEPATTGLRDAEGRRLLDDDAALDAADRRFALLARDTRASVTDGTRCHFGHTTNPQRQRISDGNVWCGPVLLLDSDPDEAWVAYPVRTRDSGLVTAKLAEPSLTGLRTTTALPPAVRLWRPDGADAADGEGITAPDAPAQDPSFVEVLDTTPPAVDLTAPPDGRLITPARVTTFDGLARTPKIGTGRDALVAAPGEDLVVARFTRTRPDGAASGAESAVVVAGGSRIPIPRWSSLTAAGVLVVSVPDAAADVALEVLFAGRAQTISLVTGERGPDVPAALYRSVATVGLGAPVDLAATLPEDQVVRATGVALSARLEAWRRDEGWAPPGQAFLSVEVEDWSATRPCCRVSRVEVDPQWRLRLPDGAVVEAASPPSRFSAPAPVFLVPEGFDEGTLELTVRVTYVHQNKPGEASGGPLSVTVSIPA